MMNYLFKSLIVLYTLGSFISCSKPKTFDTVCYEFLAEIKPKYMPNAMLTTLGLSNNEKLEEFIIVERQIFHYVNQPIKSLEGLDSTPSELKMFLRNKNGKILCLVLNNSNEIEEQDSKGYKKGSLFNLNITRSETTTEFVKVTGFNRGYELNGKIAIKDSCGYYTIGNSTTVGMPEDLKKWVEKIGSPGFFTDIYSTPNADFIKIQNDKWFIIGSQRAYALADSDLKIWDNQAAFREINRQFVLQAKNIYVK